MSRYYTRVNDVEFDHVFTVMSGGTITDGPSGIHAPESVDGELSGDGWEYFTHGYTGQYGYRGPIMHASEFIGGRLERDILSTLGIYASVVDTFSDAEEDEDDAAGWAVVRYTGKLPTRGRYIGTWHGGHSYSHGEWTDAEWFGTLADAVDALRDRRSGRSCTFRYVVRADDVTDCPCAHDEWSGGITLYRITDDISTDDVEMMIAGDGYPDRIVEFGPRGGIVVSRT